MENDNILVDGGDWQATFTPQSETAVQFEFGEAKLQIMPLLIGKVSEAYGLIKKLQHHQTVDGLRQSVNLSTVIPFGAEPNLKRDISFFANHAAVSSYIELKGHLKIDRLNIDPLFLPGSWKRIGIINIPVAGEAMSAPQWHELDGAEQVIYDSETPFLVCLVENQAGEIIEIGTGNDLWRWQSAAGVEAATAQFTVSSGPTGVAIERNVFIFAEETEMANRPWRFKWYFAWGKTADTFAYPEKSRPFAVNAKFSTDADKPSVFAFNSINIPDVSAVIDAAGNTVPAFCLESNMIMKQLRKFIRSATEHCQDQTLVLVGLEPHICASASHLERRKKEALMHWDIMSLFEFYDWANRQLAKRERQLQIMPPEGSNITVLPSISGMMN